MKTGNQTIKIFGLIVFLMVGAFAAKKVFVTVVDQKLCNQCGECVKVCPTKAIKVTKQADGKDLYEIDPALCNNCGICIDKCEPEAISLVEKKPLAKK